MLHSKSSYSRESHSIARFWQTSQTWRVSAADPHVFQGSPLHFRQVAC